MPLDPSEYSVRELRDELSDVDDADELEAVLEAERDGDDRTTAISAIEGRLSAVGGAETEDDVEAAEDDEGAEDATAADEEANQGRSSASSPTRRL